MVNAALWRGYACVWLVLTGGAASAETDVAGARDSDVVSRFPRSWIVDFEAQDESIPYAFVMGPVDKKKREVRIDEVVRVEGRVTRITYRLPEDTRLAEAIDFVEAQSRQPGRRTVFSCRGPDCGRSTIWANDVFHAAVLAAPNHNQYYAALVVGDGDESQLAAIYAVQKGNRRVYLHVDQVDGAGEVLVGMNRDLPEQLSRMGSASIDGVEPQRDGALGEQALERIDDVASRLGDFRGQTIFVVCHVYGSRPVDDLFAASQKCAATAAERLDAKGIDAEPFAAGPMMPFAGRAIPRIELVVPRRLRSE